MKRIKCNKELLGEEAALYGYYNELYAHYVDDMDRLCQLESRIDAQETILDLIEPVIESIVEDK